MASSLVVDDDLEMCQLLTMRADILGVQVNAINMHQALETIERWISRRESNYVCVAPAHAVMDYRKDPTLLHIANSSGLTTPDGMSIVWLLKLMGYPHVSRVCGSDLLLALCERSVDRGFGHFFFGGAPGVAETLADRLQSRFPSLTVSGTYTPPFRPLTDEENRDVIDRINTSGADIVWVGISTPKQERWMADHVGKVSAPVLIGVGAAFDFVSGTKKRAPIWMQRAGLEWLFRLISEPRRLWKRYVKYPLFLSMVLIQFFWQRWDAQWSRKNR